MKKQKIVIVSGATGDLGRAYLEYYAKQPNISCYGLIRREERNPISGVEYLTSDLEDAVAVREQIQKIPLKDIAEVILIHPVGKFKFEPNGIPEVDKTGDGIDDDVFTSNVDTFHNIARVILEQREEHPNISVTLAAFGSLSDPYEVPWWGSYTKSKLILRKEMRDLSRIEPAVNSVFMNLSSVKTSKENKTRPYADTKYWLSPEEVVERSVRTIENPQQSYSELDLYNPSPEYTGSYYKNFEELRRKWLREMNGGK
ncbi:hypothetical protein HZA97_00560 [Candidatus Woesearchaeota archaeon]|nr:hypothetical protein [Candidatus Woesearchaeota archaeon]